MKHSCARVLETITFPVLSKLRVIAARISGDSVRSSRELPQLDQRELRNQAEHRQDRLELFVRKMEDSSEMHYPEFVKSLDLQGVSPDFDILTFLL
ncbi:hypothetical protein WN55_10251 [Dufourea novaeangliae]|uniref:Uncharacterized protein n=1 Tax=Dufourea novaeangliae TaxID=178035 RepID=A0A154P394_DUFNO|nr:hypothetical protein WN55_10251 [Dufourea novaeangliae]